MLYFRIVTICLLFVYFVSAAGCHCFDVYQNTSESIRPFLKKIQHESTTLKCRFSGKLVMHYWSKALWNVTYVQKIVGEFLENLKAIHCYIFGGIFHQFTFSINQYVKIFLVHFQEYSEHFSQAVNSLINWFDCFYKNINPMILLYFSV